jgi:lysozyme family protein
VIQSNFVDAFEAMIVNEGGYTLHTVAGDRGGMTYAGISRRAHPEWTGWVDLDAGRQPEAERVRALYKLIYWDRLRLDDVQSQRIARTLFDFGVNAGTGTAAKLAQLIVGVTPDGVIGPRTLAALNTADPDRFALAYALAKIARYRDIVTRDRSQSKFLLGWINRTLKEVAT